eukprot:scaffold2320_cov183-Pinguiococcus_pyrenoidosus.AAC.1
MPCWKGCFLDSASSKAVEHPASSSAGRRRWLTEPFTSKTMLHGANISVFDWKYRRQSFVGSTLSLSLSLSLFSQRWRKQANMETVDDLPDIFLLSHPNQDTSWCDGCPRQ